MSHFIQGVIIKGIFWSEFRGLGMYINGHLKEETGIKRES